YPLMMLNIVAGMFIRGEGKPQIFMLITILSNIVNVYLDYLLVSRLNLGMQGAALASGIAVFLGSIIYLFYFLSGKSVFNFTKPIYKSQEIREMCYNGSSELIGQLSMSITTALFNIVILNIMGVQGVAAMTIIGYLGYIHSMIIIGIGQGMSPIISYSHGAEDYHLIDLFRKYTQRVVFVIGILLLFFIYTGNQLYIRLFTDSSSTIMMVSLGIKIYSIAFIVNGYNMIASFFFTSIGSARESAIISGMRGLVLLSLSIIILPIFFKEIGIWIAVPFTEIVTFLIALKLISTRKQKQYSLNYIQDS
ncbi:MAG: MATE family efflux transporter, partial [Halanaerobiales bacterium]